MTDISETSVGPAMTEGRDSLRPHSWEARGGTCDMWDVYAVYPGYGNSVMCMISNLSKETAHKIAAAPDLYDALDWITLNAMFVHPKEVIEMAQAALAKARGAAS